MIIQSFAFLHLGLVKGSSKSGRMIPFDIFEETLRDTGVNAVMLSRGEDGHGWSVWSAKKFFLQLRNLAVRT